MVHGNNLITHILPSCILMNTGCCTLLDFQILSHFTEKIKGHCGFIDVKVKKDRCDYLIYPT